MAEYGAGLGETTFDVYLNGGAYWRNVPSAVWDDRVGSYQVLKKWLSYREHEVLGRRLRAVEVQTSPTPHGELARCCWRHPTDPRGGRND